MANLAPTDYLILLIYFFFVLAVGVSLKPLLTSSVDYLQAGRALPAWVCGLGMTAASLGSQDLIGMGAAGARYGFASIPFYLLGAVPVMLFAGLFLVPVYYGSKARTIPEYLAFRFGQGTRVLHAWLFAAMALFSAGTSLYAMGRVFAALHIFETPLRATGMGSHGTLILSMAVPAALVLACILLGGLSGTIYNLVIQFFVMVAGLFPVVFLAVKQIGGWKGLWAPAGLSSFAQSSGKGAHVGPAALAAAAAVGLVLSAGTWCADFRVLQVAMAAKDAQAARRAPLIAAAARIVVPFLLILPAIVALGMPTPHTTIVIHNDNGTIYHDITVVPPAVERGQGLVPAQTEGADEKLLKDAAGHVVLDNAMAVPNMLAHFLPAGLLGLGIAALLASMMAGAAASLTAFGAVFTCDLYESLRRKEGAEGKPIVVMRRAVLAGTILAFGVALLAIRVNSLIDAMALVLAIVIAPLLAVLPGPESFHLHAIATVLVERRLYRRFQPFLVVIVEPDEFKWLKMPRDWAQHFGRSKDRAAAGEKHQLYYRPLIQRLRQAEQTTAERDDLQFRGDATHLPGSGEPQVWIPQRKSVGHAARSWSGVDMAWGQT